jgi:IS1 family transposase
MDKKMVGLSCKVIQMGEIHSFVGCKEKNKANAVGDPFGDVWTWTSICADTKIMPSWRVGDRSLNTAYDLCDDLSRRFTGKLQITTDGAAPYRQAVLDCFPGADFAQLIKIYGTDAEGKEVCTGARKVTVRGNPNADKISTSYIERSNLTIRMQNRRFTRRTNGYSKKIENHCHMLAVTFTHYNFCRKHQTLGKTPAVAAGIASSTMTMEQIVEMIDAYHAAKLDAQFEAAFAAKFTQPRTEPKTHEPVKLTPWYLDPNSGGPNPLPTYRRPGIKYQD